MHRHRVAARPLERFPIRRTIASVGEIVGAFGGREGVEGLAERVTRIKTKFWIAEDEQNDLFTAAKLLMKAVDDKKLLNEESLNMSCSVQKSETK